MQQPTAKDASSRPTRKRRRTVISCTECHRRKQKCDRRLPCSNCVFRNKQSACQYENESAIAKHRSSHANFSASSDDSSRSPNYRYTLDAEDMKFESESAAQMAAFGYAKSNNHNSLAIFRKIENHNGGFQSFQSSSVLGQSDYNGLTERYKSLIRQLPARTFVDDLLVTFFQEVNWHYSAIDQEIFMEHLQNWNNVSFSVLNRGPHDLPGDIRFFPALLFQVLALALQFQPPNHDPAYNALKYVSEMSLDDVANDYSESGVAIVTLLGKRDISLVSIQAGFLRTSFLKNNGMVTESWHSLGQTIRDAQEIGWHKDPLDCTMQSPGMALETIWLRELQRRVWTNLQIWDAHMALVLGRPTLIDFTDVKLMFPIDVPSFVDRKRTAPVPRSEIDPPTPVTLLIHTNAFMAVLQDILSLEKQGANTKDYTQVEKVHQDVVEIIERLPPYFRSENPDTSFDGNPDCPWLPASRQVFDTTGSFVIMSLHKPYVFTNPKSRHEALKACLIILRAQRKLFQHMAVQHYKLFSLFMSTFDAIVLLAAIFIIHPAENVQYLSDALQHFEWALERFELMSSRNKMARAALGVLQAIHVRLNKALRRQTGKTSPNTASDTIITPIASRKKVMGSSTSDSTASGYISTPKMSELIQSSVSTNSMGAHNNSSTSVADQPSMAEISNTFPRVLPTSGSEWGTIPTSIPLDFTANFDPSGMAPLQPMHDLLFNDLVGMSDDPASAVAANVQSFYDSDAPWQFEGEFRDDSFWNFMNQYNI